MKVIKFEGTPEEFQVVAHLFSDAPPSGRTSPTETDGDREGEARLDPKEAIRAMLRRRPISKGQRTVYKALADGELSYPKFLEKTGKTAAENAGVLGALGRRINMTKEIHQAGLPGNVEAVLCYRTQDDGNVFLSLTPDAEEVLQEEGII
jgi:hypothetical protein